MALPITRMTVMRQCVYVYIPRTGSYHNIVLNVDITMATVTHEGHFVAGSEDIAA